MELWNYPVRKSIGCGFGEDFDESVLLTLTAKREASEEANIEYSNQYIWLDNVSSIPSNCFEKAKVLWGEDCYVIPEYCFGVELDGNENLLSTEHSTYKWCGYEDALKHLKYDSNKTALLELDCRIKKN